MDVLAIHGSPRKRGNSMRLLSEAVRGAEAGGARVELIRPAALSVAPCRACDRCAELGRCVQRDDMDGIYPVLKTAPLVFLASPVYFLGPPAQLKALIDRGQALWWPRRELRLGQDQGITDRRGYLLATAAAEKPATFGPLRSICKAFFWSIGVDYAGELTVGGLEGRNALDDRPEALKRAYALGRQAVTG